MTNNCNINVIVLVFSAYLFSNCSSNRSFQMTLNQGAYFDKPDIAAKISDARKKSIPYHISNITINGNNMIIDLQYLKSCSGNDKFELLGLPLDINYSPPRRIVELVINNFDKNCKSMSTHTITVNISELASSKEIINEVDLYLDGWRQRPMTYIFVNAYE